MRDNKKNTLIWTTKYALLNICYFAAFCTIHAYAAVFLLAHGFSNTRVGILLALANILSALFQPMVAGIIDKGGRLTNKRFIVISVLTILVGSLVLMVVKDNGPVIFAVYALIYMIQFTYQPIMTALCFEYRQKGCDIVFGLARGLGSAGFALTSAIIGGIVERNGVFVLLVANVIFMVLSALVILTWGESGDVSRDSFTDDANSSLSENKMSQEIRPLTHPTHNNILDFARAYPAFVLFLFGTICFFFAHNMINDFMIQIIRDLGGGEKELGYCNFLQAILELPVMALIGFVLKKIKSGNLLIISGVGFLIKIAILIFAVNMAAMYLSQSFQLFAYAVFIPAAAYYVNETMDDHDQVKGQAYITSAITIGGVFSNLVSGRILDVWGVKPMLIVGTLVCAVGVVIAFAALRESGDVSRDSFSDYINSSFSENK